MSEDHHEGDTAARDLALLQRWRAGDHGAGETLLREYKSGFRALCRRLGVRSEDETVELFQDVVMAVIRHLPTLPEKIEKSFSGWFFWQVRAALSKRRGEPENATVSLPETLAGDDPGPEIAAEVREAIRRCAARLPPVEQQVFDLRYVRGLSLKESAAILGSNANAVGQSIFRLTGKMRACLAASGFAVEETG